VIGGAIVGIPWLLLSLFEMLLLACAARVLAAIFIAMTDVLCRLAGMKHGAALTRGLPAGQIAYMRLLAAAET
jgi:hypothetical protein